MALGTTAGEHVDVVVVGSGFGGAVSAYRFASADRRVAVLERGRPYPPGSFPRSPAGVARNMWDPSQGMHGLFDVWSFRGLDAVVSSGLGGGSLIYANVLLRKDEKWFVKNDPLPRGGYESWPVDRAALDPHYDAVEAMLAPQRYPFDRAPYDATPKTAAMRDAADRLGLEWSLPPLAVSFAPRQGGEAVVGAPIPEPSYGNVHGLPRRTCRLCGECDFGCNDGAKNTLDHTYLSAARSAGADLRTGHEVRGFRPLEGGGYEVRYVVHEPVDQGPQPSSSLPVHVLTCDRLVLAAGALGTTYLLLRNRSAFPGMSLALGTRFTGNGDLLTMAVRAKDEQSRPRLLHAGVGPVITSAVRVPDSADGGDGRGFYVQDAGYPAFVDWLIEQSQVPGQLRRALIFSAHRLRARLARDPKSGVSAEIAAVLGRAELSSSTLPMLGMGRDVPDGVMRLRHGHLDVDWTTETSLEFFQRMQSTMRQLATAMGAGFRDNPLWLKKRVITVHPLGGAPMGRHSGEGVIDGVGEVFGFPGLYVADGAAMPGPIGPNPSLTIAALADRMCTAALEKQVPRVVEQQRRTPSAPVSAEPSSSATKLWFTEEMKGFFELDVDDPDEGQRSGRSKGQRLNFRLTITTDDVDRFIADPMHEARAEGTVFCDPLGGTLPVQAGWFNLFTRDAGPGRRRMLYRLHLADAGGNPLTLVGHKDIEDHAGFDIWRDTSTLYVRLLSGHVAVGEDQAAQVVGAGIMTIHLLDFAQQMTTFRTSGPEGAAALGRFLRLFLGDLYEIYGRTAAR